MQVRHKDEVGLVAGFYSSGDSARPGFGWYFGRDTLYTLFAVNSYGDFHLTREALDFLMKRQRDDGKMPHEWSQTADLVDWKKLSLRIRRRRRHSALHHGNGGLRQRQRRYGLPAQELADAVQKAWEFERTHDTDGDGIYDNSQGTGWVENWDPYNPLPHQEIYLAAVDQQASGAMGSA